MPMPDQAILLTAPGAAAIAVVRLHGQGVDAFLTKHFSRPPLLNRPVHGEIRDGERVIDDPVVAKLSDELADVCLHGGAWVVHAFLELARANGFSVTDHAAMPLPAAAVEGESEIDREVAAYLPIARTELALRVLLAQPAAWMRDATRSATQQMLADRSLHWLLHPPRVAIVGAANVGKSTLANQLFARERVITADLPGTTRDWVGEIADVNGLAVLLVDTPGVRETADPLERQAIALSRGVVEQADAVVLVLDPTQPMEPDQSPLVARFANAIVVINKSDRGVIDVPNAIHTVATTGEGVDELRRRIARTFGCDAIEIDRPRVWTERQRQWFAESR